MPDYIHGSTDRKETARLEHMAGFTAHFIFHDVNLGPGQRVLDLACGVGVMTEQLTRRFPGIRVCGIDIQLRSLLVAQSDYPIASYLQADSVYLPFQDETFDWVHCSWLLEHVQSPLTVLGEVRRVLKGGGQCQFTEVDNSSFRTIPAYPEIVEVMGTLNQIQVENGGDPTIGCRLDQLLLEAGFSNVTVVPLNLRGDAADPFVFQGLVEVFANIFESVEKTLGPELVPKIQSSARRLRELPETEGGAIFYSPVVGRGFCNKK